MDKGSCFHVGDGFDVNIWIDTWIPWFTSKRPTTKEPREGNLPSSVADMIEQNTRTWNMAVLEETFCSSSMEVVGKMDLPNFFTGDKLIWTRDTNGRFSLRSAYQVLKQEDDNNENPRWKTLWKSKLLTEQKCFYGDSSQEFCLQKKEYG